jgi:acyl-CoA thioesterase
MTSTYLADTATTEFAPNILKAEITDNWSLGGIPNGGYLMAMAAKAMAGYIPHKDPVTVTGHFPGKVVAGEALLKTEIIKQGRSFTTAATKLVQDDVEKVRFTGTFTTMRDSGFNYMEYEAPEIPDIDKCVPFEADVPINDRFDLLYTPETAVWLSGKTTERAEIFGWIRFSDGTEPDIYSLLLFADAVPRAVFARIGPIGWIPTMELTVHPRQKPEKGWLRFCFRTRFITNSLLEDDGELWDSKGNLVAISRQMGKLILPKEDTKTSFLAGSEIL